ncbi:MAG: exodeoxyribonuclease VII large subunit [Spirochaetaceae bacterium]|jgi:exodeoxyribonuclease VII large subunit|nr:exodeoxyribonuclease VII large subunit [Spirochaetaceae bacterium]
MPGQNDAVFSVSQITGVIKDLLEGALSRVTVEGEISNCKLSSTGHLYFRLKDDLAVIEAVMFKGNLHNLNFRPQDGMLVRTTGSVSVYLQRGNYQIVVNSMASVGTGAILQMLEERKRKLAAEGLFDQARKRPLPAFPRTIGVVTSPTGAALRDILQITRRRNPGVSVVVLPCAVQGAEAPAGILRMIHAANYWQMADVLIVGRGGGSLEDLLPFSDEGVVRAVAASAIPVVSAVGHEIDWALSDFAADMRAPTPSAAAELVVPEREGIFTEIWHQTQVLEHTVRAKLDRVRILARSWTPESLEMRFRMIEQPVLNRLETAQTALRRNVAACTADYRRRTEAARRELEAANPRTILGRGYSVVRDSQTRRVIRTEGDTAPGAMLEILPATGSIVAQVTQVTPGIPRLL